MGKVKSLLPDGFSPPTAEPLYYPGEVEEELRQAFRQHELSHYTTQELYDEINRRTLEPFTEIAERVKAICAKYGVEEAPF